MKKVSIGLAALAFAFAGSAAFADSVELDGKKCSLEPMPAVPDAFESEDQKNSIKDDVIGYMNDSNDYLSCVEGLAKSRKLTKEEDKMLLDAYNGTIDKQEKVAGKFNEVAKAFNEANS